MPERPTDVRSGPTGLRHGAADLPRSEWRRFSIAGSLLRILLPLAIVLVVNLALYTAVHFSTPQTYESVTFWYRFVDANLENSLPTWINSTLWALAGLVAGYIARRADAHRRSWWMFSGIGILLSIDEAISLHERLEPVGEQLGTGLAFAWVLPGLALTAVVVLLLIRMVLSLPPASRNGLILSGVVFLMGGVGVETFAGFVRATEGGSGLYSLLGTLEEGLEILGVVLCLVALLHLIEYRRLEDGIAYRIAVSRP